MSHKIIRIIISPLDESCEVPVLKAYLKLTIVAIDLRLKDFMPNQNFLK